MHKFNRLRQVAPICPYGRTCFRHLLNNIEPSVYGGDAPYGKLLWPLVVLDTPTYTVTQITQRFEPSTVLWAFHTIQPSSLIYNDILQNCHPYVQQWWSATIQLYKRNQLESLVVDEWWWRSLMVIENDTIQQAMIISWFQCAVTLLFPTRSRTVFEILLLSGVCGWLWLWEVL